MKPHAAVLVLLALAAACLPPKPVSDDALKALRQAVAMAELTLPFAKAACEAIRDDSGREKCIASLTVVPDARAILDAADACASGDRECRAKSEDAARAILPRILPLASAPHPSASASHPPPPPSVTR